MSDTPRTDAARISAWGEGGIEGSIGFSTIPVEFCRQLERELAAAIEQRDKARNDALELAAQLCDSEAPCEGIAQKCAEAIRAKKEECGNG